MSMITPRPKDICIVATGACTAVGASAAASAAAVRAGISGYAEELHVIDDNGEPVIAARAPYLEDGYSGGERFTGLMVPAFHEALASVTKGSGPKPPISVLLGTPGERPGRPRNLDELLRQAIMEVASKDNSLEAVDTIPGGHAAALMALEKAASMIRGSPDKFFVVGGVDSYLDPDALEWIIRCGQLHNATNAYGFTPGEAAGFVVLCSRQQAKRRALPVLATVLAASTKREKALIKTDDVCLGLGLAESFGEVLQSLPTDARVDEVFCDQNGEPYRADEYGFASARHADRFRDQADFTAPADCWGDVGAASGSLFALLATAAGLKGYATGTSALLWASSEAGERGAALLHLDAAKEAAPLWR
jgi:3-oxoacyl-[acyl-carrier-protein] synthase-1